MKGVFSRKGYDSQYGGYPSAILPSGDMLSFPIPVPSEVGIASKRLGFCSKPLAQVFKELGHKKTDVNHHLDPDLGTFTVDGRPSRCAGIFGQASAASGHLDNQGVAVGDLFLFFGTFQEVAESGGRLAYVQTQKPFHALFGYLIVENIIYITEDLQHELGAGRLLDHPHWQNRGEPAYLSKNRVYLGTMYGSFRYSPKLRLSKPGHQKSLWSLPPCFSETKISYHDGGGKLVDGKYDLQTVGKGQEFVFELNHGIHEWVKGTIREHG